MDIGAVIFDIGEVLVGMDLLRGPMGKIAARFGTSTASILEAAAPDPALADFVCGRMTPDAFREVLGRRFGLSLSEADFTAMWCDIFVRRPDMESLFAAVCRAVPTVLLSDIDCLHWHHLEQRMPVLSMATATVLSFQTGWMKPDPRCFRQAVAAAGVPPGHCLFIDDKPALVEAARQAGLLGHCFTGHPGLADLLNSAGLAVA